MDLTWSSEDECFRREVRTWLEAHLPAGGVSAYGGLETVAPLRAWERELLDAGYGAVSWPVAYGGGGFEPLRSTIFSEEYDRAGAPRRLNYPALGLLGPTLMQAGTEDQRAALLPRILRCDDVWCQGFSEPDAGSDLASLRTRAERRGDVYRVNGQKTWCSNGPRANKMFALVRTHPDAPKHHGISYVLVDLTSPGVEVRPIRQISGASLFADVFFSDVEVPVDNLVGKEHEGWRVAHTTLRIERTASSYPPAYFRRIAAAAWTVLTRDGCAEPSLRVQLAKLAAAIDCYELNFYAVVTSGRSEDVARLDAIAKLCRSTLQTSMYELAMRSLGSDLEARPEGLPQGLPADFHARYWHARASLIYGGTNEIQRNIIGERLLGLPREPRP